LTPGGALLVVASPFDAAARDFVDRHGAVGAMLLTPRDLSREGWRFHLGDADNAVVVASGRRLAAREIRGVLTRLYAVSQNELPHIASEDRAYVAAEMTAFLLAFLTGLSVRVANRPTPLCLCGRHWSEERWRRAAYALGLATEPAHRKVMLGSTMTAEPAGSVVTVVGDRCFGDALDVGLAEAARGLAQAAGAELLAVEFDGCHAGAAVRRATPLVDLGDARIAAATVALFGDLK
jgi:hypothetical protein